MANDGGKFRDYISEGDYVEAYTINGAEPRIFGGIVKADEDGTLRVFNPDRDPVNDPDDLDVNASWVNINIWKKGGF